jgi:hypothetical protein
VGKLFVVGEMLPMMIYSFITILAEEECQVEVGL